MKRALILAHDFPYPPNHGGRYDMFFRLKALKELGFKVSLIATVKEEPDPASIAKLSEICDEISIIKRQNSLLTLISPLPHQTLSRSVKGKLPLKHKNFDLILLEDLFVWKTYEDLLKFGIRTEKVFVRLHNDNVTYFKNLAKSEKNLFKKLYYLSEAFKFFFLEKRLRNKNLVWLPISYEEAKKLKKKFKEVHWLPVAVDLASLKPYKPKDDLTVLFLGNLFTPNNLEGLFWYLDKVHPILMQRSKDYRLIVAGNTRGNTAVAEKLRNYPRIEFINSPPEVDPIYGRSAVFINPILRGAGVKVKNIDATLHGLPVVSTSVGNEGTGFKHKRDLFIADDPSEFAESILKASKKEVGRSLVESAQKFLKRCYDHKKNLAKILEKL